MLTVRQLILLTHNHRRSIMDKAREVGVRFVRVKEDYDEDGDPMREVLAICRGETVERHVALRFYGKGANAYMWCSCDCEYFLYHCEVADQRKGSSDIEFSNGRWPRVTNPRGIAHLCKHIVACISHGAADKRPAPKKMAPTKPQNSKQPEKVTKPAEKGKETAPKTGAPKPTSPGLQRLGRSGRLSGK